MEETAMRMIDQYRRLSDEQLVVSEAPSDVVLQILYERYVSQIRNYIRKYVRNEHDVEDIVSDTFCRFHKFRSCYKVVENASFKTYLFRIALSVIYTHFRKRRRFYENCVTEDYFYSKLDPESGFVTPLELISTQVEESEYFDFEKLNEVLERTKKEKPEFYKLLEDYLFNAEVPPRAALEYMQKKYNIPLGTVKSRMHRVRKYIKKQMSEHV